MRHLLISTTLFALFAAYNPTTHAALAPGDILFTLFDADDNEIGGEGDDQLAFVALTEIAESEAIYFTDEEWTTEMTFTTGEGAILWTPPLGGVAAGTVVRLGTTDTLLANFGALSEPDSGFNISGGGDTIWAYQGELQAPTVFLSAISTEGLQNTLAGTGLVEGETAINFDNDYDHAQYIGPRFGESSIPDYLPLIAGDIENNWFFEDNVSGVDFLADTTPFCVSSPGDFNCDGFVDAADYAVWRNNLDEDEGVLMGGGDGLDGVDIKDYDIWRMHFGTAPAPVAAANAAPEPTASVIAVAVLAALAPMRLKHGY